MRRAVFFLLPVLAMLLLVVPSSLAATGTGGFISENYAYKKGAGAGGAEIVPESVYCQPLQLKLPSGASPRLQMYYCKTVLNGVEIKSRLVGQPGCVVVGEPKRVISPPLHQAYIQDSLRAHNGQSRGPPQHRLWHVQVRGSW